MSDQPNQPIEQRPASGGDVEIREGAWHVAHEVLNTAADVGGVVGGVAAVKAIFTGSGPKGGGGAGEDGGSAGGTSGSH